MHHSRAGDLNGQINMLITLICLVFSSFSSEIDKLIDAIDDLQKVFAVGEGSMTLHWETWL